MSLGLQIHEALLVKYLPEQLQNIGYHFHIHTFNH